VSQQKGISMRYKFLYITAFGLTLGYLATQTMQTPPPAPAPSRQPSPTQQEVPYDEPATAVSEKTGIQKIERFIEKIEYSLTLAKKNLKTFQTLCAKILEIFDNRGKNKALWIKEVNNSTVKNISYVQKLTVGPKDLIFIFGDLHGDSSALLFALEKLIDDGVLNDQWELEENNHLVFLGDYTDRGHYGVEVWYILLNLIEANPDPSKIIVLRGNHESIDMNMNYREGSDQNFYIDELNKKFALPPYSDDPNTYIFLTQALYGRIPAALYITCNNERILCAHGGLELGFNPQPLLSSTDPQVIFMPIKELKRASEVKKLSLKLKDELERSIINHTLQDFVPTEISELHFLWSDFSDNRETIPSSRGAGWTLGSDLTKALLERDTILCVFRGHQHSPEYIETLIANKGFYSFEKNPIHTIISFSKIQSLPILCEHYSFIKLEVGKTCDSWKAWHMKDGTSTQISLFPPNIGRAPSPMPRLKRSEPETQGNKQEAQATDQQLLDGLRAPYEELRPHFDKIDDSLVKKTRTE
jgi:hypothetical protein